MRIAGLFTLLLSSLVLHAQQPSPQISKVGVIPTSPASGKEMFRSYCAACHGPDGKGNGPAAPALKKPPTDLTLLAKKEGGKYPALRVTSSIKDGSPTGHGSKDMPVWGPLLLSASSDDPGVLDQRIANLVGYIKTLQAK